MKLESIGVTTAKANQFKKKGIESVEDLLRFLPRKYLDYRFPKTVRELKEDEQQAIIGTVQNIKEFDKVTKVIIKDSNNQTMDIVWFRQPHISKLFFINSQYIFCGKVVKNNYDNKLQMISPLFSKEIEKYKRILPIYSKIKSMSDDYLLKQIEKALANSNKEDYLDLRTIKEFDLVRSFEMERIIHHPKTMEELEKAKARLVFDELFRFTMILNYEHMNKDHSSNFVMNKADTIKPFLETLPFNLTDGENSQLATVRNIFRKMRSGQKTQSLIQGDVGCGKTMVAMLLMMISAENGYQSALMAPTKILATQHYEEIVERMKIFPHIKPVLLAGKIPAKEKRRRLKMIEDGEANLIIGTHSVVSKGVKFKNLALTIVDEEHRFGVVQRKLMQEKSENGVHHVTMSATPIPRSLALSLYGDAIDVYTIKTLPNGRKPVLTTIESEDFKVYELIRDEINKGRQAYMVCPLVEATKSERLAGVDSVDETFDKLNKYFKGKIKIGKITGKMSDDEAEIELNKFANKEYDLIVATTIIEVGVNVPNSTIIAIKNSERFGLSQLHQLRGRVGRGSFQSYCILMTDRRNVERLEVMTKTTDGFVISENDLKLRGTGDFIGTKQSGENKAVMLMLANPDLFTKIKSKTKNILETEKCLAVYSHILEDYDIESESNRKKIIIPE